MTKRDELIEAAARALYEFDGGDRGADPDWDYAPEATAALDAILEGMCKPSDEMVEAGQAEIRRLGDDVWPDDAKLIWRATLDALKAEK